MVNYQNAIIYKICCKDVNIKEIYIGSTTQFKARKWYHKNDCNNKSSNGYNQKKYKFIRDNGGWDNWDMIQIKPFPCDTKRELETEERKVIEELKPELNIIIPTRTKKEYQIENKERLNKNCKEWREKNKESIADKKKEYYEKNKERISERRKEKHTCECGTVYTIDHKKRHEKTIKHQNFIKE